MFKRLTEPFRHILKNRELIMQLAYRDLVERYKGQPLGMVWTFIHPAIMIFIYIFLFGVVFQMRASANVALPTNYSIYLLSGMVPWLCMQTSLTSSANSIVANGMLVKQVVLPVEIYPVRSVASAFLLEMIYLVITLIYSVLTMRMFPVFYLLLPVGLLLQTMMLVGIAYLTSSLNAYLKDIKDIVQVFCSIGVYIMPVLYLPEAIPAIFRPFLYINPFSYYIWMFQDILNYGSFVHPYAWVFCVIFSLAAFYGGDRIFQQLKTSFGSVL